MAIRISAVVSLVLFTAWLSREPGWEPAVGFVISLAGYVVAEVSTYQKKDKGEKSDHRNRIISAKVTKEDGPRIHVEVWYFYDGSLGSEDITISVTPLDRNKAPLRIGMSSASPGGATILNHAAMTVCQYSHRVPDDEPVHPRWLRVTMAKGYNEVFCERDFRFRSTWKPKTKEANKAAHSNR